MSDAISLYNYFRSSCSYRARIALELKGLSYDYIPVHLIKDGGEQHQADYRKLNPLRLVPTLQTGNVTLTQSLVIMEYLDETYPSDPVLFPRQGNIRYKVKELCEIINSSIQPLTNIGPLQALEKDFAATLEQKNQWIHYWNKKGFDAFERLLEDSHGTYCVGDQITAADLCLIPQIFSAERFGFDMSPYPLMSKINESCLKLEAFRKAHPDHQVDSPRTAQ